MNLITAVLNSKNAKNEILSIEIQYAKSSESSVDNLLVKAVHPMTTAAAIDRIVHHAVILELTGPSSRAEAARARLPMESAKQVPS